MGEWLGTGTPDDHGKVLKEDRHSDGRNQRGQTGRLSQWAIGDDVQQHAADRAAGHGQKKSNVKGQTQNTDESEGEKCAQHVDFAVGEIYEQDNTIDHGVTHGNHGVYSAYGQSVYKLL